MKSEFLNILQSRGFIHQCTDLEGLDALMSREKITAYIGFDCTAPSLHVGSLMQIMVLRWLQKTGHKPIVLMGGGTTKIGDPSGKDEARKVLADDVIAANMAGIKKNFEPFMTFGNGANDTLMVNNDDWLKTLNYIEFLGQYGRHFSINRMLTMDSVKLRLERQQHLSFLEFNYMILQAYDFVELASRNNCRLQIGGSDQWGNIVSGTDLWQHLKGLKSRSPVNSNPLSKENLGRIYDDIQNRKEFGLFGLTTPLITTSSGAKMGKTAAGAVWLNADMLSPYDYWQFWRNTEDADVWRFLKFFTEIDVKEIERMEREMTGAGINEAKKILATEATKLCHGEKAANDAAETARKAFEQGAAAAGLPEISVSRAQLAAGIPLRTLLVDAKLAESGGDAKKLIEGNGVRVNDQPVTDINFTVNESHLVDGTIKISKGKKHHVLVRC